MSKLNLNPMADWGYVNNSRFRFLSIRNQGGGVEPVPPEPVIPTDRILYTVVEGGYKPESTWITENCSDNVFDESTGKGYLMLKEDVTELADYYDEETGIDCTIFADIDWDVVEGDTNILSITIPTQIISINENCFNCYYNLEYITIPDSVTSIGSGAFNETGWFNSQPDGILYLNNWCIGIKGDSEEITSLNIREGIIGICDGCFSESYLQTVTMPNTVKYIGEDAFSRSVFLTTITLSNSLISIKRRAFGSTSLSSITIPSSVVEIDEVSFDYCSLLSSIKVDASNPIYDSRNNCNAIIETSSNTLLRGCSTTIIPNTVASIGSRAFNGSGITTITIPDSVTSIGAYAFEQCRSLATVKIGNGVTIIEGRTFSECRNMTSLILPESLDNIYYEAFTQCTSLTSVTCYAITPPSLDGENFRASNDTLYVPTESVQAYLNNTNWNAAFGGNIQAIQE